VAGSELDRDVLAQWEGWLCLVEVAEVDGAKHFEVETSNVDGVIVDSIRFAHDDLLAAAKHFHDRGVARLDLAIASAVKIGLRGAEAVAAFDHETIANIIHDEFVTVEHRPISYPNLNKTQYLELVEAHSDIIQVWLTRKLHAATPTAFVVTGAYWTPDFGNWSQLARGIFINVVRDEQITHIEIFPEDQLERALARFHELSTSPPLNRKPAF
jgi:hypothetical protein